MKKFATSAELPKSATWLTSAIVTLFAFQAFGNKLVDCKDASTGQDVWSFQTTTLGSRRLASNITLTVNGSTQIVSAVNVAQYRANNVNHFIMIDNPAGTVVYTFSAAVQGGLGVLNIFANGKETDINLRCTYTTI